MHLLPQGTTSPEVQPTWIVWRSTCNQTPQIQPSVRSTSAVSQCSTIDHQVMYQFTQMKTMLPPFLRPRQETTRTAFCNYLASEVEILEERDFQTFRNEAVKLLSGIQSRAGERSHQLQQPQQPSLSRSSSATSTYVSQQPAPTGREYILTISEAQMPTSQVIQSAQQSQVASRGQQQPKGQPTSFVVVDVQPAGPSRPLSFILTSTKHLNLSAAFATGE